MKRKKTNSNKILIDLDGPEGNAFVLLGLAKNLAKQLGKDDKTITKEMMKSDYNNLIEVIEKEFGDYIILESSKF